MAVTRVCYTTREIVKAAASIKYAAWMDPQVDLAIGEATAAVEGQLHRRFYPTVATKYFDWPNFQYAYPWELWLDQWELADVTVNVPVVTSGGTVIPAAACNFEPVNDGPPYTSLQLRRDMPYGFGNGPTPQRDTAIAGTFGYWTQTTPGGTITAALTDTTGTTVAISNSAAIGVGDHFLVDSERMLAADKAMADTTFTQTGSGCTTANLADQTLTPSGGTFYVGETLLLDAERMLIVDKAGSKLIVKRQFDGTTLATHSNAEIYAARQVTVQRGILGTTAATHASSAAINVGLTPDLVRDLSTAEALVTVRQKLGAYATDTGTGQTKKTNTAMSLPDQRAQCYQRYGRQARRRVI